jgi:ElaB/YqjD/DUF883 family membrane-anchored ribosome-binding protein
VRAEARGENPRLDCNDELKNMLATILTVIHQSNEELRESNKELQDKMETSNKELQDKMETSIKELQDKIETSNKALEIKI